MVYSCDKRRCQYGKKDYTTFNDMEKITDEKTSCFVWSKASGEDKMVSPIQEKESST